MTENSRNVSCSLAILNEPDLKRNSRGKRYLADLFFEQEEDFVLTGKRFRLKERTLVIEVLNGERKAVTIPVGTIIQVAPGAVDGDQTLHVLWNDRTLEIFACDLNIRGTEIIGPQSQGENDAATLKRGGGKRGIA